MFPSVFYIFLMRDNCIIVLPIDESARVAEQLLGPYTDKEHAKRGLVVHESRLNRAYADQAIRLAEHADPDEGKKKQTHVPEELDAPGPIAAWPLRAIGASDMDSPSCARVDIAKRPLKRASQCPEGPTERPAVLRRGSAQLPCRPLQGVTSSFRIAGLPLEESSVGSRHRCTTGGLRAPRQCLLLWATTQSVSVPSPLSCIYTFFFGHRLAVYVLCCLERRGGRG